MLMSGNTILVTGGSSGIGRALAEAFHALGNTVVITGRRKTLLDEVAAANPGMKAMTLDIANAADIKAFSESLVAEFPQLNVVVNNAGIMRAENLLDTEVGLADAEATFATNLLGPIRLTSALLPHLRSQPRSAVINVSSGLAFVPRADTPTYSATKAAMHSYSESLRFQLRDTSIQVHELIPPYVQTELMGSQQAADPAALPLKDFIEETMSILSSSPDINEVCIERVKPLRFAATGDYATIFQALNNRSTS